MKEFGSRLSKKDALKNLRLDLIRADHAADGATRSSYEISANQNESLAKELGATNFEIVDVYFSAKPKELRQNLLSAFSNRLKYQSESFESFEELTGWVNDLKKIRDKYCLEDPLKPEEK